MPASGAEVSPPMAPEDLITLLESLEQLAQAQSSHPGLVQDPQVRIVGSQHALEYSL